jgi:hypothetical protein
LRERHFFCARHRTVFLFAALTLASFTAWTMLPRMYPRALRDDLILSILVFLYLFLVHVAGKLLRRRGNAWLPKELMVGVIFSAATAVPAWSHLSEQAQPAKNQLAQGAVLFALLCWINCVAIDKWESGILDAAEREAHATTHWLSLHLRPVVAAIALFCVAAACLSPAPGFAGVYLSIVFSCGFLLLLDARQASLSPLFLRIGADAALLTPLAVFPLFR